VLNVTEFKLKSQQKTSKTKDSGLKASRKTLSNHLTIIKIEKDTQQFVGIGVVSQVMIIRPLHFSLVKNFHVTAHSARKISINDSQ
jgi:hypothetical protein